MSDNDENKIVEEEKETIEESVEKAAEEVKETVEDAVEEIKEAVTEKTEDVEKTEETEEKTEKEEKSEDKPEKVEAEVPAAPKSSKKISNNMLIAIGAAVAVLVLIIIIAACAPSGNKDKIYKSSNYGYIDSDNKGYVLDGKGGAIEVADDVTECFITEDKKHIVYIDDDGKLYVANGKAKNPEKVGKDVDYISATRNDGFVYVTKEGVYYRYSYSKKDAVKLGSDIVDFGTSTALNNAINVVYFGDGKLNILPSSSTEPEKIAKADNAILNYISQDGKTVVWTEVGSDKVLHITTAKEDKEVLESDATFSTKVYANGKKILVFDGDNKLYNIDINGKIISETKIKDGTPDLSTVSTSKGAVEIDTPSVSSFYVSVHSENGYISLYYIDGKGNATEILDEVGPYSIANGKIFFLDNGNIKTSKIGKDKIKKAEKIYKDIKSFTYLEKTGYLVMKNDDGELLCAKPGKDPIEVSDKYKALTFSEDQKTIYFVESVKSGNGDLMSYKLGSKEAVEIADDVYYGIIETGTSNKNVSNNQFYFFQKSGKKEYMMMFNKNGKVKEVVDGFKLK